MSLGKFLTPKRPADAQVEAELRFHLDRIIEEKIASGLDPREARRQAALEFGGREQVKEDVQDVYRVALAEHTVANLRSGFRLIRKSPSFSLAVILTLALGIGANSAVFSAISAILLRPLPFPNGDELMLLEQSNRSAGNAGTFVAPARLEDWNRLNHTFQTISGWYSSDISDVSGPIPEKVTEALVAPRFLQVWGISPALGRDFSSEEEHFGGPTAVLISDRYWRRRFHAESTAVGKRLRLEGYTTTVVGVLPASFLFPDRETDIWTPSPPDGPYSQSRDATWFTTIGRLKPGTAVAQARADLATVQAQLGRQFPKTDAHLSARITPLKDTTISSLRHSLWILFGSVSLLLFIACTNIAALMLARTTEREREIAIRFSLGASRLSIVAQLLTECLVLATIGSALGLFVAAAGSHALRILGKGLPRTEEITLDWRIVLYALACALLATLLCGLFPAIRGTRRSIASNLAHASRTQVSTRNSLQWTLVGIQVALAVTLLVGAALLLRSFQELGRVSPGFEVSHILTFRISGNWGETVDRVKLAGRINRTLDQLRTLPGITDAATSASMPGSGGDSRTEVKIAERSSEQGKIFADSRVVSNGYFATMRIPLLEGESCRESVKAFDSAIVNRSFANRYLSGMHATGHHVQIVTSQFDAAVAEIRGVAGDAREQGLNHEPVPTVYWCGSASGPTPLFLIHTRGEPLTMADTIRRAIQHVDPGRSVFDLSTLDQHLSDSFAENRLRTILLTLFALTAVALVCVGLYGTLSYFVAMRKREVGLRLALGALQSQIVGQFLLQGVGVSAVGILGGVCLAAWLSRGLAGMLYGVSVLDPKSFVLVTLLILAVAAAASFVPSLRAARVDPMQVLREE